MAIQFPYKFDIKDYSIDSRLDFDRNERAEAELSRSIEDFNKEVGGLEVDVEAGKVLGAAGIFGTHVAGGAFLGSGIPLIGTLVGAAIGAVTGTIHAAWDWITDSQAESALEEQKKIEAKGLQRKAAKIQEERERTKAFLIRKAESVQTNILNSAASAENKYKQSVLRINNGLNKMKSDYAAQSSKLGAARQQTEVKLTEVARQMIFAQNDYRLKRDAVHERVKLEKEAIDNQFAVLTEQHQIATLAKQAYALESAQIMNQRRIKDLSSRGLSREERRSLGSLKSLQESLSLGSALEQRELRLLQVSKQAMSQLLAGRAGLNLKDKAVIQDSNNKIKTLENSLQSAMGSLSSKRLSLNLGLQAIAGQSRILQQRFLTQRAELTNSRHLIQEAFQISLDKIRQQGSDQLLQLEHGLLSYLSDQDDKLFSISDQLQQLIIADDLADVAASRRDLSQFSAGVDSLFSTGRRLGKEIGFDFDFAGVDTARAGHNSKGR